MRHASRNVFPITLIGQSDVNSECTLTLTHKRMCDVQNDDEKNNENERVMMKTKTKQKKTKNLQK